MVIKCLCHFLCVTIIDPVLRNLDIHLWTVTLHDKIFSAKLSLTFLPQRMFCKSIIYMKCLFTGVLNFPSMAHSRPVRCLPCLRKADWYQAYSNQQGNRVCLTNKFSRGLSTLALDFLHNGAVLNIRKHCWSMLFSCTVQSGNYRFISKYRVFQEEYKINFVINTPFI